MVTVLVLEQKVQGGDFHKTEINIILGYKELSDLKNALNKIDV